MENQNTYKEYHNKISKVIEASRLNEAFTAIKKKIKDFPNISSSQEQIENLEETYKYLLHYMAEGFSDPSKDTLIENIKNRLHHYNDLIFKESVLTESPEVYYSTRRMVNLRQIPLKSLLEEFNKFYSSDLLTPDSRGELSISFEQSETLKNIFNQIWTVFGSPKEEYLVIESILSNPTFPSYLKSLTISAILLGNISFYDSSSFNLLLDSFSLFEEDEVRLRALTAIILISIIHSNRILIDRNLQNRLKELSEDPKTRKEITNIILNIVQAYDTKRVTARMKDELIPGLMKIRPDIIDKLRDMSADSENFLSEENPDWEDIIENSGVSDKLREINEMQMEGSDVMMTTFASLKNFPFFNNVHNWFFPFTPQHPEVSDFQELFHNSGFSNLNLVMCDSDEYSFILSLKGMPQTQRDLMFSRIKSQMKEASEVLNPDFKENDESRSKRQIKFYIQDIYRFFKLFKKNSGLKDPFENSLKADQLLPLLQILSIEPETIQAVAEFFFKHGYFEEAADFFKVSSDYDSEQTGVWEKTGYCLQKLGKYSEAIEWYKKAELINPDNQWVDKKLAVCLKNNGEFKEALPYYNRSLEREPENFHLLMSLGQCLLEAGDYSKALEQFYHADYIKPDHPATKRAIAWTLLLNENFEKSSKLYEKLTNSPETDKNDWINAGHNSLANNNFKEAIRYYKGFLKKTEKKDITDLILALREDAETLKNLKIPTSDLRLIVDKIRYDLNEE